MTKSAKKTTKTYSQLLGELTEILEWFESDNVDLDEAVANYQKACKLLEQMENYLKTAENKVKKISATFKS